MTPQVRPVTDADRQRWQELWRGYIDFYQANIPESQFALTFERLLDPGFNMFGLVAESNGDLVGLVHYSFQTSSWSATNHCYLEDLFTAANARGNGVGRALIDAVFQKAEEASSSRLYWNTDASNEVARRLYDTYGRESGKVQYRFQLQ